MPNLVQMGACFKVSFWFPFEATLKGGSKEEPRASFDPFDRLTGDLSSTPGLPGGSRVGTVQTARRFPVQAVRFACLACLSCLSWFSQSIEPKSYFRSEDNPAWNLIGRGRLCSLRDLA